MVVVKKNISREKGEAVLFDEIRYLFYITNDRDASPVEIVFGCKDRCGRPVEVPHQALSKSRSSGLFDVEKQLADIIHVE